MVCKTRVNRRTAEMYRSSSQPRMAGAMNISALRIEDMHGASFTTARYLGEAGWVVRVQVGAQRMVKPAVACVCRVLDLRVTGVSAPTEQSNVLRPAYLMNSPS